MEIHYDVKYVNHDYRMIHSIADMVSKSQLTDCSLIAEGKTLRAHRVILGAASDYLLNAFNTLPEGNENESTVCIFDNVRYTDVFNVVKFIYTGKVTLSAENTVSFIRVGNMLKVRGIIGLGIDIKKESSAGTGEEEAGTSKGVKRSHDDDDDDSEKEEPTRLPTKRTRRKKVYVECTNVSETEEDDLMHCNFCKKSFNNKSTLNNHERFCEKNPNRKISTCPICGLCVKPGSMTFHKKSQHGYVPKSRKRQLTIVPARKSDLKVKLPPKKAKQVPTKDDVDSDTDSAEDLIMD